MRVNNEREKLPSRRLGNSGSDTRWRTERKNARGPHGSAAGAPMSVLLAIRFVCPTCKAEHTRGYFNGVDVFRCLRCGYTGFGHHPDPEIDREIQADIKEAESWDEVHGMSSGDSK
jgi:Zn ribbon nucleic-acid-binding protein